jgi:hypothetical protein
MFEGYIPVFQGENIGPQQNQKFVQGYNKLCAG